MMRRRIFSGSDPEVFNCTTLLGLNFIYAVVVLYKIEYNADMRMTKCFFKILVLLFAALAFSSGEAGAQSCDLNEEVIYKLKPPTIGAYNIWDNTTDDETLDEAFVAGEVLPNDNIVVVGERIVAADKPPVMMFSEIDRRGRAVWEKTHEVQNLTHVKQMFRRGEELVVLAQISDPKVKKAVWIGFFNLEGDFKSEQVLKHPQGALAASALVPLSDGNGFLLAVGVESSAPDAPRFSIIYRLNRKAQMVSKRSYVPGPDNEILGLSALTDGTYIASGYINDAKGRRTGWLMIVDVDGNVIWQRQYPRGAGAQIAKATPFAKDYIAVVGKAYPLVADGFTAGWVMVVQARNGDIAWQRYFTGDYDYAGVDIAASVNGLMSVVMDANKVLRGRPSAVDEEDYVRLLTLNPRGVIFDNSDFFNADASDAREMIIGPAGERVLIGSSLVAYMDEVSKVQDNDEAGETTNAEGSITRSREGWVVAVPAMDAYEDPCVPKKLRTPGE